MDNKRSQNFTTSEEVVLVELVQQKAHILENKRTDAVCWKQKRKTWEDISEKLEVKFGIKRTAKVLRDKFDNMKKKTGKTLAAERKEIYMTGGGTMTTQSTVQSSTVDKVAALMGCSATGLCNDIDSDNLFKGILKDAELEDTEMGGTPDEEKESDTWERWNPAQLRRKPNSKLTPIKAKPAADPLLEAQQWYFENEERRTEERHQWEKEKQQWAKENHEWEKEQAILKIGMLRCKLERNEEIEYRRHLFFCSQRAYASQMNSR